jgi:polysaccharide export outer membrane protein
MPGDVLQIPVNTTKVAVLGTVKNPGTYLIPDGGTLSLSAALAAAGGTADGADIKNASILRREGDQPTLTTVDLGKVMTGKSQDIVLKPNDILFVPDHSKNGLRSNTLNDLIAPLAILSRL